MLGAAVCVAFQLKQAPMVAVSKSNNPSWSRVAKQRTGQAVKYAADTVCSLCVPLPDAAHCIKVASPAKEMSLSIDDTHRQHYPVCWPVSYPASMPVKIGDFD
jgi:hypothetical protein